MSIFSAIQDALTIFKKKTTGSEEEDIHVDELQKPIRHEIKKTSASKGSLLHSKIPEVYGIKKKLTLGVLVLFGTIFLLAFFLSAKSSNNRTTSKPTLSESGANSPNTNVSQLPNSYDQLAKYNTKQAQLGQNGQAGQGLQPTVTQPANLQNSYSNPGNQNYSHAAIPQIPTTYPGSYTNPGGYYPATFIDPQGQRQATIRTTEHSDTEEYLKSPIGFAIAAAAAGGTSSANAINMSGNSAQSSSPMHSDYVQPEPYVLQQGAIIPVTLLTGIDSDLPGQVVAQVRENVYDSVTGDYLLIPQGTRLLGGVSNKEIGTGQERIGVAWQRLILPNGVSVDLGSMEGVDTSGYTGLKDQVDNHTRKIIGAALFSSILSATAQIAAGNTDDSSNDSAGQLAVSGAATSLMNAGAKILDKQINVNPTIKIRPGIQFNIFVNKDVVLRPYYG